MTPTQTRREEIADIIAAFDNSYPEIDGHLPWHAAAATEIAALPPQPGAGDTGGLVWKLRQRATHFERKQLVGVAELLAEAADALSAQSRPAGLEALRELSERATQGEYVADMDNYEVIVTPTCFVGDHRKVALCAVGEQAGANTAFLASAVSFVRSALSSPLVEGD